MPLTIIALDANDVPQTVATIDALLAIVATAAKQDTLLAAVATAAKQDALLAAVATASRQDTGNTSLNNIDGKIPALGQAAAAASVPVVLTAAQLTTLTPPTTVGLDAGANTIGSVKIDQSAPGTSNLVYIGGSLPAGTSSLGGVTIVDGGAVTLGAKADSAATTDTGTFTLMSMVKRIAQTLTSILTSAIPAGTNLIGKVGIDQTDPGVSNAVQLITALPAGSNTIGNIAIADGASTALGATAATVATTDTGTFSLIQLVKRGLQGISTMITALQAATPAGSNVIGKVTIDLTTPGTTNKIATDPIRGTLTDKSGTIATGATAQTLAAINSTRSYFFVQNLSSADLWINFTTTAVASQPSIKLQSGASFVFEGPYISTELISIIGATTGQAFAAKEG